MNSRRAYKTELRLNKKQKHLFYEYARLTHFAYNWGVQKVKEAYENGQKFPTAIDLYKQLCQEKRDGELSWMYNYSKSTPQEALRNVERAFKSFFHRVKKGQKPGYPRFKSKKGSPLKFTVSTQNGIRYESGFFYLPRIGWVRTFEKDYVPEGLRVSTAYLTHRAGRWFISVQTEFEPQKVQTTNETLGVDLGIKTTAVVSNGEVFENPRIFNKHSRKLRKEQRRLSRKQKGSNNREKQKHKVQKAYYRLSTARNDYIHKMTSSLVRTKPKRIVLEDLNVSGLVKNKKLSRHIADTAFGEIRRQLEYKCDWAGIDFLLADRYFPSSKMCSQCGAIKDELSLSERVFECDCGNSLDRDLNAAINLRKYGELTRNRNKTKTSVESDTPSDSLNRKTGGEAERYFYKIISGKRSPPKHAS